MQVPIPIRGPSPETPQPSAPLKLFLEHPLLWWAGLNLMERIAVLAVLVGLGVLAVATSIWLRRIKLKQNGRREGP